MRVRIRRIYEEPHPTDGARVLVDRLWPRGISKERAHLDSWCKDIAPSSELRRWYGHDPDRFEQFAERYRTELDDHPEAVDELRRYSDSGSLTLLTAAKSVAISHAAVLQRLLTEE
ncbi:hypothetical protein BHE97_06045 [Aeromicrobium sp. PE09-221]|uniref:DUF488 domain-containing protein n=1 Tax=Aeromicrobium sp. PE09-221 TaxID=1898043 RepID=UPI000B3ED308|nr:DUF488 family protein [Aeromicrobium sp. PE09-221]OUZ10990.1 hypothetical protein BHE97_06045 [Aeromicrobium sp. PE09-221]